MTDYEVNYAVELQLKLSIAMDSIDTTVQESWVRVKGEDYADKDGNPVEVYRKERYGHPIVTLTCNSKSILFSELFQRWAEHLSYTWKVDKTANYFSIRNSDECPTLVYSQTLHSLYFLDLRMKELKVFIKEIFDIDLDII